MNSSPTYYDIAITGGGLAGLSAAILLAKSGYKVVLFEKETYPFHKVCGEYISMESWDFLCSLGLPLDEWELPRIHHLKLSSPGGSWLEQPIKPGGFGISRYKIDLAMVKLAQSLNVQVCDQTRVSDIQFKNESFTVSTDKGDFYARVCCGAFGKRSNIDVKWKRGFILKKNSALNNYIGVKYHAYTDHARDLISLHNFKDGYCGVSPVEDNKTCICYLTSAQNLRSQGNNIAQMEKQVLQRNPHLKQMFNQAEMLYERPLTISQVSFDPKKQVENHVLMLGDAAGLITPLCGNGMSMALHSSKLAATLILAFLAGEIDRNQLENSYAQRWSSNFLNRLRAGRIIQMTFGKEWLTNLMVRSLRPFPSLVSTIVKQTNGGRGF